MQTQNVFDTIQARTGVALFPHQLNAIQWMQRTEGRTRMVPEQPHGGILAHAMGLGKTITTLSMISMQGLGVTIIVCPKSVITQWRDEAVRILNLDDDQILLYHGNTRDTSFSKLPKPASYLVLTTFEIVRLSMRSRHPVGILHRQQWDRIILDEAHRICEQSSKTARAIRMLRARNRWCITGTPFKNGVTDLVALSKFLLVPPYCNSTWWRCHSHNEHKIREWRNMFVNLQDKRVLSLPSIVHHVRFVGAQVNEEQLVAHLKTLYTKHAAAPAKKTLVDSERALIDTELLAEICSARLPGSRQEYELLKIMRLRQSANHPLLLTNNANAMIHLLAQQLVPTGGTICNACNTAAPGARGALRSGGSKNNNDTDDDATRQCAHVLCHLCAADMILCPCCLANMLPATRNAEGLVWRHSAKTRVLADYLTAVFDADPAAKLVLFSQWTTCLDMLASLLDFMRIQYGRFDGRVNSIDERADIINTFRENSACQVLLTSLGAGGEGLNLTFANHVVLLEPYWNLAAEQQAIDRLHRIGQKRVTNVLRLHVHGSIENWVQEIQNKKNKEHIRLLSRDEPDAAAPITASPAKKIKLHNAQVKNRFRIDAHTEINTNTNTSSAAPPPLGLSRFLLHSDSST
jgi:SNF2 family DNA or RNA helicase